MCFRGQCCFFPLVFVMATVSTSVWTDVLGHVKLNYPHIMRGWFSQLSPTGIEAGTMVVVARNGAQVRYLDKHCKAAFAEAGQAATGRLITATFQADAQETHQGDVLPSLGGTADGTLLLNPDYTFENFVTGPCNRLAHAAARAVADNPGRAYNPFFVHGAVGLGKTHLIQAVCHELRKQDANVKCHYISCEMFTNDFIEAIEQGALHQFRYRYRQADALVIDDVQFLADRERSQEELFHTFNTLTQSQRQIILSADCAPPEIPSLKERLVSRFNSGLVTFLDRPCLETRMAIIHKKAQLRCIELPEDVVQFVARRINTNNREIDGALTMLDAVSQMDSKPITLKLAQQALGKAPARLVTVPTIMDVVALRMNVKVSDLQSKRRSKSITHPRHVCMYLARELTTLSLEQIGGYFGGRDHTTVLHAHRTIMRRLDEDPDMSVLLKETELEARHACA